MISTAGQLEQRRGEEEKEGREGFQGRHAVGSCVSEGVFLRRWMIGLHYLLVWLSNGALSLQSEFPAKISEVPPILVGGRVHK